MKTVCNPKNCKLAEYCGKYWANNFGTHPQCDFSTCGKGTCTEDDCTIEYYCGDNGDYKMFEGI